MRPLPFSCACARPLGRDYGAEIAKVKAVDAAVALAKGQKPQTTRTVNNGRIEVPSILIEPVSVDKTNIDDTVVKDGFQKREDIYRKP